MSQLKSTTAAKPAEVLRNPNLHIIFCITLAAVMGVSSITPALPMIANTFGVSIRGVAWLITIFTLPGILLTPVLGVAADLVGRKKILFPSMILFGLAGFACTFATSYEQLLFFRLIQGIGAAAIGALNITMIGDIFQGNERARAMGYNSGVLSFGATLYPLIGGALATLGWYFPFYLPLLAIPVAFLILYKLENPEPSKINSKTRYFKLVANHLKNRRILLLFGATLASFLILYGSILTMIPFLIYEKFSTSALIIGLSIGSTAIGNGISAFKMGSLAARFSEPFLLKTSFIIYGVTLLLIPFAPSLWVLCLLIMIFGLAQGINIPVIVTLIAAETRLESRAAIMSLNGMVLRIAQTIGPVFITSVFVFGGFTLTYIISGFFALLMGVWMFWRLDVV